MSIQDVQGFYARLAEDKGLREKVSKAAEGVRQRINAAEDFKQKGLAEAFAVLEPFAREAGFRFTLEDLNDFQKGPGRELTTEQLDAVAGGGGCGCVIGGAGYPGGKISIQCLIVGTGDSKQRCYCFLAGGGTDR